MKKLILSLMSALPGCVAWANCVSVQQVGTNYTNQTVTFTLTWNGCSSTATHLNKVWCFVDVRTGTANGSKGTWTRAAISGTPSVVNGTYAAGNAAGFYVTGANGQSATVTVKLGNAPAMFDWCAFATDYPPNIGTYNSGTYTLNGTQPFVVNGSTITGNQFTGIVTSLTDATGCPGCGGNKDVYVGVGGACCPPFINAAGYCRHFGTDNSKTFTGCANSQGGTLQVHNQTVPHNTTCPSTWRGPTSSELRCLFLATQGSGVSGDQSYFCWTCCCSQTACISNYWLTVDWSSYHSTNTYNYCGKWTGTHPGMIPPMTCVR